jgi:hypothetical protein
LAIRQEPRLAGREFLTDCANVSFFPMGSRWVGGGGARPSSHTCRHPASRKLAWGILGNSCYIYGSLNLQEARCRLWRGCSPTPIQEQIIQFHISKYITQERVGHLGIGPDLVDIMEECGAAHSRVQHEDKAAYHGSMSWNAKSD